jgi:hypothetical protein
MNQRQIGGRKKVDFPSEMGWNRGKQFFCGS